MLTMVNDVRLRANQPPIGFVNPMVSQYSSPRVLKLTFDDSYTLVSPASRSMISRKGATQVVVRMDSMRPRGGTL